MPAPHKDSAIYHDIVMNQLVDTDTALAMVTNLDIPGAHSTDAVTKDWLQEQMGNSVSGARLDELIVEDEHDGMTSRKKWSLKWNAAGVAAGLPDSIFVKATPPKAEHRVMLSVLHMPDAEAQFYKVVQPELPHIAPKAFYAESYIGGRHLIILDDLVKQGCTPFWQADHTGIAHVKAVCRALAQLHARYWDTDRFGSDLAWLRPTTRRYGWSWLMAMYKDVRAQFKIKADASMLPDELRPLLDLWGANCDSVYAYCDTIPNTLLHGDSHVGNTFAYPDGSAGLFDWQVAYRGPNLRDLAYFMMSAMDINEQQQHEREVVDYYLDCLAEFGVEQDRETAWNLYCIMVLDRWDAGITSWVHGTYNHAESGQMRSFKAMVGSLTSNNTQARLEKLLADINP